MKPKKEVIVATFNELEKLRFKNRYEVKKYLEENIGCKVSLEQSWKNKELDEFDFLMVGHIENDDVFCDFDIYYTKSKTHYLITETSYEFEG